MTVPTGSVPVYDGAAWQNATPAVVFPGAEVMVVLDSDVGPIASQTALQSIGSLLFAIGASATERWELDLMLIYTAADAVMDLKFGLGLPAGVTGLWGAMVGGATGSNSASAGWAATATGNTPAGLVSLATAITAGSIAGTGGINLRASILGGGTAGNVQAQYAQATSQAANLTIKAGSRLLARKLAL